MLSYATHVVSLIAFLFDVHESLNRPLVIGHAQAKVCPGLLTKGRGFCGSVILPEELPIWHPMPPLRCLPPLPLCPQL